MARPVCKFPGCEDVMNARGLCGRHYRASMRGTLALPEEPASERDPLGSTRWQEQALCRLFDPEIWFPVSERGQDAEEARQVCNRCPVRGQCLDWALDALPAGIAGGMTTDERRALRRERAANADRFESVGGPR